MIKLVIIGSGPAGLTAGIYAARAGLSPVIYSGINHGGQLVTTTDIENFPGFADPVKGPKLMEDMSKQAKSTGAKIIRESVLEVDFSKRPFNLQVDSGDISASSIIIATGASANLIGIENEKRLMGKGVSVCATCDGFFYRNKKVAIIGGGDTAFEEANYLSNLCSEVVLIHRRNEFRASNIMVERARKNNKIKIITPCKIEKILDKNGFLDGVEIKNIENSKSFFLKIDGLFIAIGHSPNSKLFKDYLDIDENGYIKTYNYTQTSVEGIFAAGDVVDSVFRQAITSAGMGCQAAMQAQRFIELNA